jgi:hypothetical protein
VLRIEDGRIIDDERPSNSGSTDTRHHATRKRKRINA